MTACDQAAAHNDHHDHQEISDSFHTSLLAAAVAEPLVPQPGDFTVNLA
jgi:hypothetical protein